LRALTYFGRHHDLELPLLQSVLVSNNARVDGVVQRILRSGARNVGLYGLSFKRHTDDLRESPFVTLAERLIGKGIKLRIYDENIQLDRLTGANKEYITKHIPHLVSMLVKQFDGFDGFADLVVIGHRSDAASAWVNRRDQRIRIIDLARLSGLSTRENYEGVSW
jgi:GDP-mannose 6-dehydrogenase